MNTLEQNILRDLPARVRQIVIEVAEEYDTPIRELFGACREPAPVMARWAAMYRTKAGNPALSAPQVGEMFRRNHTTVLNGWARYAEITGSPPLTTYNIAKRVRHPALAYGKKL